jgi:hypothetical protein
MSSLLGALCSTDLREEGVRKMAGDAARDAVAAKAIAEASKGGNPHAKQFVKEATSRIVEAKVRQDRAGEIRKKSAKASVSGAHKLAVLGSDVAATEDSVAASLEGSVVDAVRASYGGSPFYMSPRESQLWRQSDVLQSSTSASVEKAFSNLLDKAMSESYNYGEDSSDEEFGAEEDSAFDRLGLAAEVFGGHLPAVLGAASIGAMKDTFKASREKLQKRLEKRQAALKKLQESAESGKKVVGLKSRVAMLKKSIAKTKAKLKKLDAAETKVKAAEASSVDVSSAEAEAKAELMELEGEDEELEPFEFEDSEEGDEALAAEVLGADEDDDGDDSVGFHPRPWRGRGWSGRPWARRRGWGWGGPGPWVEAVPVPVYVDASDYDDDDEDADIVSEVMGADEEDSYGGGAQPVSNLTEDTFVAFFDRRASELSDAYGAEVSYGAGSQPISSVVEIYGNDDAFGGVIDSVLDFFSDMFQTTKAATKKATRGLRRKPTLATPLAAPASAVQVKDGPYTYQKDVDGSIVIVAGPSGVGKRFMPGSQTYAALDAAVKREVDAGRSMSASSTAMVPVRAASSSSADKSRQITAISMNPSIPAAQKREMIERIKMSGDDSDDDFGEDDDDDLPEDDSDLVAEMGV